MFPGALSRKMIEIFFSWRYISLSHFDNFNSSRKVIVIFEPIVYFYMILFTSKRTSKPKGDWDDYCLFIYMISARLFLVRKDYKAERRLEPSSIAQILMKSYKSERTTKPKGDWDSCRSAKPKP